jgi:hypothetical protein
MASHSPPDSTSFVARMRSSPSPPRSQALERFD